MRSFQGLRDVLETLRLSLAQGAASSRAVDQLLGQACGPIMPPALADGSIVESLVASLGPADEPTLARAIEAFDAGENAWLGFKLVTDPQAATRNLDPLSAAAFGETGSADGEPLLFFADDARTIVSPRPFSERDRFQMLDATRGPAMHADQFEGVFWLGMPLRLRTRLILVGAGDVSMHTARLAHGLGFEVMVIDHDPDFLTALRFPDAARVLVSTYDPRESFRQDPAGTLSLFDVPLATGDFVCVLTRGHVHDHEACAWAARSGKAVYIGMMGCAEKNAQVREQAAALGLDEGQWERIKRPIGIDCGARSGQEIAVSIAAELIDERFKREVDEETRARHRRNLLG